MATKLQRKNEPGQIGNPNVDRWCKTCGAMGHSPSTCPNNKDAAEWCDRCKSKGHLAADCRTPEHSLARCVKAGEQRRKSEEAKASGGWNNGGGGKGGPTGHQGKNNQKIQDLAPNTNAFANFATNGTAPSAMAAGILFDTGHFAGPQGPPGIFGGTQAQGTPASLQQQPTYPGFKLPGQK